MKKSSEMINRRQFICLGTIGLFFFGLLNSLRKLGRQFDSSDLFEPQGKLSLPENKLPKDLKSCQTMTSY